MLPGNREQVGYDGMRRRAASRLADAHADTGQQQVPEMGGAPRKGSHPAPNDQGQPNDVPAAPLVGHTGYGQAKGHIKDGEGKAGHEPQLRVGEAQLFPDGFLKDHQDLPVDKAEDIDHR